jgi:hypothetical protein
MKLTNLAIHLLNGLLLFLLTRLLFYSASTEMKTRVDLVAALIAAGWMLLPINLTGVLYVVQRMESIANLFVLAGLIGYVTGRRHMLGIVSTSAASHCSASPLELILGRLYNHRDLIFCAVSIIISTALGVLAKETAVMLPFYALLVEWAIFRFAAVGVQGISVSGKVFDRRIIGMFLLIVLVPLLVGLAWLLPSIVRPSNWATRDFTLGTRLLSEARIVVDYIVWTLLPTPQALSFYHDNFRISRGLLSPVSTLMSIGVLAALITSMLWMCRRLPLFSLGIALFLGCHLLTGTILPLELVYEHRNYFASFGLLLAVIPLLAAPAPAKQATSSGNFALPFALPRYVLLAGLMLCWMVLTALTAYVWGNPLRLAEELAMRAPDSPRAEYELGRTYIIYSHYDPSSPFTRLAYAPLEKAASLPYGSILPEQALIFMNARMHLPLKDAWWDSMIEKLKARRPGVQDESSLSALTECVRENHCDLPQARMVKSFMTALAHPHPSARLLATYGDYAWNVLDDHALGEQMTEEAAKVSPNEPAYQITLVRMLIVQNRRAEANTALKQLEILNIGGRLNSSLEELRKLTITQR